MSGIPLRADRKRYFSNPSFHNADAIAKLCTDKWLEETIESLAFRLTNRQVTREECEESGPYVGCSGIGFALLKAAQALPEQLTKNVDFCNQLLSYQVQYTKNASKSRETRYLCGTLGLQTIQAISDHMSGRPLHDYARIFQSHLDVVCTDGYQRIGDDDILNGRSGFLLAVQMIRTATGFSVLTDEEIRRVLKTMITSGRLYSRRNHSPAPLFYQWHNKEYLGAAHGLAGILQALMCFWDLLAEDEQADVKQTLDWLVSIQSPDGNFASSSGHIDYARGEDELVHWCHGAPGVLHCLLQALVIFQDERYLQSAKRCVELIWFRGILRKGPGICHGVSGNAYAFLLLHRVVKDPELLKRAKAFAVVMFDQKFEQLANTPDCPLSLFEGWAGALCFLCDLRNPVRAQFPLLPINFGKE